MSVGCRIGMPMLLAGLLTGCQTPPAPVAQVSTQDIVGHVGANRYYTPANQILTPAGLQVELPGMRPQALALSPDGRLLVTAGKTHDLVVVDRNPARSFSACRCLRSGPRTPHPARSPNTSSSPTRTGSSVSPGWPFLRMARASTWRTSMAASRSSASEGRPGGRLVHHAAAAGQRPAPQGGNPRRPRGVPGRQAALRGAQPLQPPGGAGRRHGQGLASLGRGRRPLRRRARRAQGLCQQLGRPRGPTRTASPAPPGTARWCAWTRCATSPAKGRCRSLTSARRTANSALRTPHAEILTGLHASRDGAVAQWPLAGRRQCRQRHAQRDRHAERPRDGDHLRAAEPGRPVWRPAQRSGVRSSRASGCSSATAPRTPSPSSTSPPASRACWA